MSVIIIRITDMRTDCWVRIIVTLIAQQLTLTGKNNNVDYWSNPKQKQLKTNLAHSQHVAGHCKWPIKLTAIREQFGRTFKFYYDFPREVMNVLHVERFNSWPTISFKGRELLLLLLQVDMFVEFLMATRYFYLHRFFRTHFYFYSNIKLI